VSSKFSISRFFGGLVVLALGVKVYYVSRNVLVACSDFTGIVLNGANPVIFILLEYIVFAHQQTGNESIMNSDEVAKDDSRDVNDALFVEVDSACWRFQIQ